MAFERNNLICLSNASAFGAQENFFSYSTSDTSTTVGVAGYFNEISQIIQMGDLVQVKASDKNELLQFTTGSGTVPVVTAAFDSGGGGGLTPIGAYEVLANPTNATAVPTGVQLDPSMSLTSGKLAAVNGLSPIANNTLLGNISGSPALPTQLPFGNMTGISGGNFGLAPLAAMSLIGNPTGATAVPQKMGIGSGLAVDGSNNLIATGGGGGDVTWNFITTIGGSATPVSVGNGYIINITASGSPWVQLPASTGLSVGEIIKFKVLLSSSSALVQLRVLLGASQTATDGCSLTASSEFSAIMFNIGLESGNRCGIGFTLFYYGSGGWLITDISYPGAALANAQGNIFTGS